MNIQNLNNRILTQNNDLGRLINQLKDIGDKLGLTPVSYSNGVEAAKEPNGLLGEVDNLVTQYNYLITELLYQVNRINDLVCESDDKVMTPEINQAINYK